jgi:hypothetical protein
MFIDHILIIQRHVLTCLFYQSIFPSFGLYLLSTFQCGSCLRSILVFRCCKIGQFPKHILLYKPYDTDTDLGKCVLECCFVYKTMDKSKNPVILSAIHHYQNPLESNCDFCKALHIVPELLISNLNALKYG